MRKSQNQRVFPAGLDGAGSRITTNFRLVTLTQIQTYELESAIILYSRNDAKRLNHFTP